MPVPSKFHPMKIDKGKTMAKRESKAPKTVKRARTAYTSSQLMDLEKEFQTNNYISRTKRIEMASSLHLSDRQIKIWFQNRRMKHKKDKKAKADAGKFGFV